MILQSLAQYYDVLKDEGKVPHFGWSKVRVSFALGIDEDGSLINIIPLKQEEQQGNKKKEMPSEMIVPEQVKKASGIVSNFLCENSSYLLGCDKGEITKRSMECFNMCKRHHEELLADVDSKAAKAVLAFFKNWDPHLTKGHPIVDMYYDEIVNSANLVFRFDGRFVQDDLSVQKAWDNHQADSGISMSCLVTGNTLPVARLHPSIKGVNGAQTMGASLVSFNAEAYKSYGKEQSYNAPVSEKATFAYTTTLNYLLSDRAHRTIVGDTTIVYWAKSGQEAYQDFLGMTAFGAGSNNISQQELHDIMEHIANGKAVELDDTTLSGDEQFFILGLAPNAARLSVRFFLQDSFGNFIKKLKEHYDRLSIVRPSYEKTEFLPLWRLLKETVNEKSRDKSANPLMGGAVVRSILNGTFYPAALLNGTLIRIRAERKITYGRAAILKAYWLLNGSKTIKEVLTVSLNEESNYTPYVMGRLFSVLEALQEAANPGINATIRDKYFNSACATPAVIFPMLLKLSNSHMRKLEKKYQVYYSQQITRLMGKLDAEKLFPARLSQEEQGAFIIGYYHQTQKRYQKKEQGGE